MTAPVAPPIASVMPPPGPVFVEVWRGGFLEAVHRGSLAVCTPEGALVEALGDIERPILPRSAVKMLQALPLVESGAADAVGLDAPTLALACASHSAAPVHTAMVHRWLAHLGTDVSALRCGAHPPKDPAARRALLCAGQPPGQEHNNCSGKHCGMLTLSRHLGAGPAYVEPDHPVQRAIRAALAETAGCEPAGYGIDGCSAPNFALSLRAIATALARLARPRAAAAALGPTRAAAAERLVAAMAAHPVLVAGEERANTALLRAASHQGRIRAVVKSGAEGSYTAILPERGLGVALKIEDGGDRASAAAMAAVLARLGAVAADDPRVAGLTAQTLTNANGWRIGTLCAAATLSPTTGPGANPEATANTNPAG
ncbi:MAG: asparaginase [Pseudomonadota bacterium]